MSLISPGGSNGSDQGRAGSAFRSHDFWTYRPGSSACSTATNRLYCLSNVVTIFWNGFEPDDGFDWSDYVSGP